MDEYDLLNNLAQGSSKSSTKIFLKKTADAYNQVISKSSSQALLHIELNNDDENLLVYHDKINNNTNTKAQSNDVKNLLEILAQHNNESSTINSSSSSSTKRKHFCQRRACNQRR